LRALYLPLGPFCGLIARKPVIRSQGSPPIAQWAVCRSGTLVPKGGLPLLADPGGAGQWLLPDIKSGSCRQG